MPFFLKIVLAPDESWVGKKFLLEEGDHSVGRISPPCKIHLDGSKVSKHHCNFKVRGYRLIVEDNKSSNGIYVNGSKVSAVQLSDRDRIVIGDFTLEVVTK